MYTARSDTASFVCEALMKSTGTSTPSHAIERVADLVPSLALMALGRLGKGTEGARPVNTHIIKVDALWCAKGLLHESVCASLHYCEQRCATRMWTVCRVLLNRNGEISSLAKRLREVTCRSERDATADSAVPSRRQGFTRPQPHWHCFIHTRRITPVAVQP